MSWGFGWRPYVPVAQRRARAARELAKLAKKNGQAASPVLLDGRKIAGTFWGKAWCDNLEAYSDYANRLPRGRTYVRNGSVVDLQISQGKVTARVSGSSLIQDRNQDQAAGGQSLEIHPNRMRRENRFPHRIAPGQTLLVGHANRDPPRTRPFPDPEGNRTGLLLSGLGRSLQACRGLAVWRRCAIGSPARTALSPARRGPPDLISRASAAEAVRQTARGTARQR